MIYIYTFRGQSYKLFSILPQKKQKIFNFPCFFFLFTVGKYQYKTISRTFHTYL